ncbi:30S ribosomal protein S13 [candidate division CPR3 bacterium 4484_211]|uniref:Small ribosomal subunit protein uS13 n=1 Tax=candidate division CPR3 bacterium 4484_211 TaxID=1968527 RepID=A0A1W9NZA1_UNCC3|nr:MAG: 30S ribosomal protein S13 [candidate division CPR3 bacterium 4484_211]
MARLVGVEIPDGKKVEYALTYIYGVSLSSAKKIVKQARVDPELRVKDLTSQDLARLNQVIEANYKVEGELRRRIRDDIRRLQAIGAYRGIRHRRSLPVRGQRTRHNARTRKGRKKVAVGGLSAKKKAARAKT